ncbi:MAG TPA: thioredoxin fold domain-containing protein [Burkholderiales bacterium]|nr:thioredoxin fold domain-containing protein [Burkholderiales bacterium]
MRIVILILACALSATAFAQRIPAARDLARAASDAQRAGAPLVVLYTQPDCVYCERAKRDYLEPLLADHAAAPRIVEVDVTSDAQLTDFSGRSVSQAAFARAQRVRILPTLDFYGPGGERLAQPLVGLTVPDFYLAYVDARLDDARKRLASGLTSPRQTRAASATGGG